MNGTVPPSSVSARTAFAELTGMVAWIDWNQVSKVISYVWRIYQQPDRQGGRDRLIQALPHGRAFDRVLRTIRRTDSSRVISVILFSATHCSDFDSAVIVSSSFLSASNRNRMS